MRVEPKDTMATTTEVEEATTGADKLEKGEVAAGGRYWSDKEERKIKMK